MRHAPASGVRVRAYQHSEQWLETAVPKKGPVDVDLAVCGCVVLQAGRWLGAGWACIGSHVLGARRIGGGPHKIDDWCPSFPRARHTLHARRKGAKRTG